MFLFNTFLGGWNPRRYWASGSLLGHFSGAIHRYWVIFPVNWVIFPVLSTGKNHNLQHI